MKRPITAALVAAFVLTGAATAQAQAPAQPATRDAIAAAKAEADAIIERGQAGEFFENVTTTATPQVRHRLSGMVCSFNIGDRRDAITFYPLVEDGPPRGDDVGCGSWRGNTFVSVFATRYPQQYPAADLFAWAVADIRQNWENVKPLEDFSATRLRGQDAPLVAAFTAERQGQPRSTIVVLRNIGEWSYKVRATGRIDDPEVTTTGTLAFSLALPGGWDIYRSAE